MTLPPPQILLVDDNPQNLRLLSKLLKHEGYSIRFATSGIEALEAARDTPPDLVLLDIMMPGMDGFEVCQHLRADSQLQAIPIIFLTALDNSESRIKALKAMGDDYLTKPIQFELLLAKIASVLHINQMRKKCHQQQLKESKSQVQSNFQKLSQPVWRGTQRQGLAEKLRLFIPDQFLRKLAPNGVESIKLGRTVEADVTILFCDIRNFTAATEAQSMQETFDWLNSFFTLVSKIVTQHGGFIDKYLGDAAIAIFDRPQHHVVDGVKATLAIQESLKEFNQFTVPGLRQPTRIGIGLHTGKGLIGTLGSSQRMDVTVIGDVVNTASRLEELTKQYGCQAIVSGEVIRRLPVDHAFQFRWIDCLAMRGKRRRSHIYETLGTIESPLDTQKIQSKDQLKSGVAAYRSKNWQDALYIFEEILRANTHDTVAAFYRDHCLSKLSNRSKTKKNFASYDTGAA
ncbi:MAG: response regulator [Cyanobacteria bacterium P01_A01_bin.37]